MSITLKKNQPKTKPDGRKKMAIIRAIESYISHNNKAGRSDFYVEYSNWYCGVTNSESVRKAQHANNNGEATYYFKAWDAGSKELALEVESHFHAKRMQGDGGTGGVRITTTFVYVYKKSPNVVDRLARFFNS